MAADQGAAQVVGAIAQLSAVAPSMDVVSSISFYHYPMKIKSGQRHGNGNSFPLSITYPQKTKTSTPEVFVVHNCRALIHTHAKSGKTLPLP